MEDKRTFPSEISPLSDSNQTREKSNSYLKQCLYLSIETKSPSHLILLKDKAPMIVIIKRSSSEYLPQNESIQPPILIASFQNQICPTSRRRWNTSGRLFLADSSRSATFKMTPNNCQEASSHRWFCENNNAWNNVIKTTWLPPLIYFLYKYAMPF